MDIKNEFVAGNSNGYKWRLGQSLATSLAGFLVGIVVSVIFFLTLFDVTLKS